MPTTAVDLPCNELSRSIGGLECCAEYGMCGGCVSCAAVVDGNRVVVGCYGVAGQSSIDGSRNSAAGGMYGCVRIARRIVVHSSTKLWTMNVNGWRLKSKTLSADSSCWLRSVTFVSVQSDYASLRLLALLLYCSTVAQSSSTTVVRLAQTTTSAIPVLLSSRPQRACCLRVLLV